MTAIQVRGWRNDFLVFATRLLACSALSFLAFAQTKAEVKKGTPTFNKDVAPILFKNCVKCHQAGELAFRVPLTSYEAAKERAESIKKKVVTREMPPWPVDAAKSLKFRNDPRLSQREIVTIVAWVNGGAPKGKDADFPPIPKSEDGWSHPQGLKPDLVVSPPTEVRIPAAATIPYVRILVKVPFEEDKWVAASQTKPSNPAVVHHMALTEVTLPDGMTPTDLNQLRQMGVGGAGVETPAVTTSSIPPKPDMLAIYTPGSTLEMYGEDGGKLLKGGKNQYIVFNIHYEATGKPERDRSQIALWFAAKPPENQLFRVNGAGETILADGKELLTDSPGIKAEGTSVAIPPIPPFAKNYELIGITAYPKAVTIYQFQPHAHHRGKDFTYTVVYPDGHEQTVLRVPKYDHRWQMAYELEEPLRLPAGSKIVVTAHYDNSKMNMHNPAPEKEVYFRDMNRSWDEMFTPFLQYSIDGKRETKEALDIAEVVGCLEAGKDGGGWLLTHGSEPVSSSAEATSSVELKQAQMRKLGDHRYQLLGANTFRPLSHEGEKVAVKGVLINEADQVRINVTSLQKLDTRCSP